MFESEFQIGNSGEVVLQVIFAAIVHEVDSRIHLVVSHLGVVWNVRAPFGRVIADEVMRPLGKGFDTFHGSAWVGPGQAHLHNTVRLCPRRSESRRKPLPGEKHHRSGEPSGNLIGFIRRSPVALL